ncbi:MAG: hypothetical protein ABSA05_10000 [Opitutaceae bacterium]|jgi:hypothetical protein
MKTSSLDLLEKSQLPPAQARAILQVMESELSLHDTALATKSDLHALELKVEALRGEVRADLQSLRAELIGEIKGTIRWNFAFWIAQLAAIAGILKLLK